MPLPNNVATIADGAAQSTVIAKGAKTFTKMFVTNFTGPTVLFFEISNDGVTYRNAQTYTPAATTPLNLLSVTPGAANFMMSFEPWILEGINFLRFTANGNISGGTACTIKLY